MASTVATAAHLSRHFARLLLAAGSDLADSVAADWALGCPASGVETVADRAGPTAALFRTGVLVIGVPLKHLTAAPSTVVSYCRSYLQRLSD
ncbi:MAG: hypothetical protein ABI775_12365 [Pseudonocardiales bacterium]